MVDVARVNMFGHPVGTFRWDERYAVARFEYAQRVNFADDSRRAETA